MNRFFISDLHLGHKNILTFKRDNGEPLRAFSDVDEMHAVMVDRWNAVVRNRDTVVVLGDVVIGRWGFQYLKAMRGRKILVKGNHDIFKLKDYAEHFEDIRAYDVKNGVIYSHVPVHPHSMGRFGINVHGHLHQRQVLVDESDPSSIDPRYFNVSVERLDYTPMALEDLKKTVEARGGFWGFKNGNGPQVM